MVKATRRSFILSIATCSALGFIRASGQQLRNLPRVALVLNGSPVSDMAGADPVNRYAREFVGALRDIGLVDGRNIIIERRSAEGRPKRLAPLMQELVASKVDVIVTVGPAASAAQEATDHIPIVAIVDGALDAGLVSSLARPGRNLTGFGVNYAGYIGKLLQLLKEAAPTISSVAVIAPAEVPGRRAPWRIELDSGARTMQLNVLWPAIDLPEHYDTAFAKMTREKANALFVMNTPLNYYHLRRVADFAVERRLPSICGWREFAEAGGLLSYGDDVAERNRRVAAYVKKILEGAKPGDLPFEQPMKFELVVNSKTARLLGLAIPRTLLARADEVIQ